MTKSILLALIGSFGLSAYAACPKGTVEINRSFGNKPTCHITESVYTED